MVKFKMEIEAVINNQYKDMDDIMDCIEEEIEIVVGKALHDMFFNSNVTCNVTDIERIRDSIRFRINMNDVDTIKRMDALVKRMRALNPEWGEQYIMDMFKESFVQNFNMHLRMIEAVVEERENKAK